MLGVGTSIKNWLFVLRFTLRVCIPTSLNIWIKLAVLILLFTWSLPRDNWPQRPSCFVVWRCSHHNNDHKCQWIYDSFGYPWPSYPQVFSLISYLLPWLSLPGPCPLTSTRMWLNSCCYENNNIFANILFIIYFRSHVRKLVERPAESGNNCGDDAHNDLNLRLIIFIILKDRNGFFVFVFHAVRHLLISGISTYVLRWNYWISARLDYYCDFSLQPVNEMLPNVITSLWINGEMYIKLYNRHLHPKW